MGGREGRIHIFGTVRTNMMFLWWIRLIFVIIFYSNIDMLFNYKSFFLHL